MRSYAERQPIPSMRYKGMVERCRQGFDLEKFDVAGVNRKLKKLRV